MVVEKEIVEKEYDKILRVMILNGDIADTPTIAKNSGKTLQQVHSLLQAMVVWGYVLKLKKDKSYRLGGRGGGRVVWKIRKPQRPKILNRMRIIYGGSFQNE